MINNRNFFIASNESEENFGEFLAESSQITTEATTKGKDFFSFFVSFFT